MASVLNELTLDRACLSVDSILKKYVLSGRSPSAGIRWTFTGFSSVTVVIKLRSSLYISILFIAGLSVVQDMTALVSDTVTCMSETMCAAGRLEAATMPYATSPRTHIPATRAI